MRTYHSIHVNDTIHFSIQPPPNDSFFLFYFNWKVFDLSLSLYFTLFHSRDVVSFLMISHCACKCICMRKCAHRWGKEEKKQVLHEREFTRSKHVSIWLDRSRSLACSRNHQAVCNDGVTFNVNHDHSMSWHLICTDLHVNDRYFWWRKLVFPLGNRTKKIAIDCKSKSN